MMIQVQHSENDLTVLPKGRLDSTTSDELDGVLRKEITPDTASLTIDMSEVDFISSKGLRVLVSAYRSLNGKPVRVIGANASIAEVFRLSGMLKLFQVNEK